MLASKFKIRHNGEFSPNNQIIFSVAHSNGRVLITLLSLISSVLPCLYPIVARRTSGYILWIFKAI